MKWLILACCCMLLASCEQFALMTTPKKKPIASTTPLAYHAEKKFWSTLHQGQYEKIPETNKLLMAAYIENPNDPTLAAHLGFIHIWKITERERLTENDPTIVNEIILSKNYFADAVELQPQDARYVGFLGDSTLVSGKIFNNQREEVHGYFILKRAIRMWPEFNYFTAAYPMSTLPVHSDQFKEGLDWQWKTMSLCAGTRIDKSNPSFAPYMSRETQTGSQRACWNSWIAPHNFEGFFLNMGDMLVKSGDWQTARKIYQNAQLSRHYTTWPYKTMLEKRIHNAKENVAHFNHQAYISPDKTILFNSGYGCVACHQR